MKKDEKKNWLIKSVLKKLGLGAEAKIEKAYERIAKEWRNDKRDLLHNMETLKYNHLRSLEKHHDKLAIAQEELEDVWESLNEDNTKGVELGVIAAQFNEKLDKALYRVKSLEEGLEFSKEAFEEDKKEAKKQLDAINLRLTYYEEGK